MGDEPRRSWYLTDAEASELQRLMLRHENRVCEILRTIMKNAPGGLSHPQSTVHPAAGQYPTRVFSKGQIWYLMLERLRELEKITSET